MPGGQTPSAGGPEHDVEVAASPGRPAARLSCGSTSATPSDEREVESPAAAARSRRAPARLVLRRGRRRASRAAQEALAVLVDALGAERIGPAAGEQPARRARRLEPSLRAPVPGLLVGDAAIARPSAGSPSRAHACSRARSCRCRRSWAVTPAPPSRCSASPARRAVSASRQRRDAPGAPRRRRRGALLEPAARRAAADRASGPVRRCGAVSSTASTSAASDVGRASSAGSAWSSSRSRSSPSSRRRSWAEAAADRRLAARLGRSRLGAGDREQMRGPSDRASRSRQRAACVRCQRGRSDARS